MKTRLILLTVLLAMILSGCAKAQTAWMTDLDSAGAEAKKAKKDLLIVFTGSDWDDPSKEIISTVFTEDFFKKASKDYVLCNIDIVQDETLMEAAQIEVNYNIAADYNVQALPAFVLQTPDGDMYGSSGTTETTGTIDGLLALLETFKAERTKLVGLKKDISGAKGTERAEKIDLFIETIDASRREKYADYMREIPALDPDGTAGLKGKYLLQIAYIDAVDLYQAGSMPAAGDLFLQVAESDALSGAQKQEAWYMGAYMYAMSESVDNDKIIAWLEKAIASDPANPGSEQIKTTIEQIKAAPPKEAAVQ